MTGRCLCLCLCRARAHKTNQQTETPNTLITITSSKYLIRYLHINWVANQVFNTSNSNVLGSHVHVNVCISVLVLVRIVFARALTH